MQELKDIRDIVVIPDSSMFWLIGISVFFVVLVSFVLFYWLTRRRKRIKRLTKKQKALLILQNLDYTDTKEVVYDFIENIQLFLNDKNIIKFKNIEKSLIQYKYIKDIPKLDNEIKVDIQNFIKRLK